MCRRKGSQLCRDMHEVPQRIMLPASKQRRLRAHTHIRRQPSNRAQWTAPRQLTQDGRQPACSYGLLLRLVAHPGMRQVTIRKFPAHLLICDALLDCDLGRHTALCFLCGGCPGCGSWVPFDRLQAISYRLNVAKQQQHISTSRLEQIVTTATCTNARAQLQIAPMSKTNCSAEADYADLASQMGLCPS